MTMELTIIESLNPVEIFKSDGIDPILKKIRAEVITAVPDVSTAKGRKEIASLSNKVAKSKTLLDNMGKKLADNLNDQLRPINAERKKVRDTLDALKAEIRQPLTEWEAKQEKRIADIKAKIEQIRYLGEERPQGDILDAKTYKEHLSLVEKIALDASFEEFVNEAAQVKDAVITSLKKFIEAREVYEKDQAELKALKAAEETRKKVAHEEKIAAEAAEQSRLQAEKEAKQAREKAEAEKQAAIDARKKAEEKAAIAEQEKIAAQEQIRLEKEASIKREKAAAETARQAEIDRQKEAERQAEVETERREANKRHVSDIRRQAKEGLMKGGLSEATATRVVLAIHAGQIPNVSITY